MPNHREVSWISVTPPSSFEGKTWEMRQTSKRGMQPHVHGRPCQHEKHGPLLLVLREWSQDLSFWTTGTASTNLQRSHDSRLAREQDVRGGKGSLWGVLPWARELARLGVTLPDEAPITNKREALHYDLLFLCVPFFRPSKSRFFSNIHWIPLRNCPTSSPGPSPGQAPTNDPVD